jgi:hypothetical protein
MASHAAGDRDPPPGESPTVIAVSLPKLPPPPTVGPRSEPPTERTAVTRAPRAAADPKELLPTLRMPPIEARSVRRDADDLAARLGIGKRRAGEADEAAAAVTAAPRAHAAEPVAVAQPRATSQPSESAPPSIDPAPAPATTASAPRTDARELLPTVPLPTVPAAPSARERQLHPQARRVPLPLPSVLRAGPRTMGGSRSPRPTDAAASERSGPPAGTPEPMPFIDTATLVAACTEQLLELEPHHAESSAPSGGDGPLDRVATAGVPDAPSIVGADVEFPPPVVAFVSVEHPSVDTAALHHAPPRRWGWIAAAAAVLALTVAGIANLGWSSDAREHKPAAPSEATLSVAEPAGERLVESAVERVGDPLADPPHPMTAAPTDPIVARAPEPIVPADPDPLVLQPEAPLADPTAIDADIVDDAPLLGAEPPAVAAPLPVAAATPAATAPPAGIEKPPTPVSAKSAARARKSSSARSSQEAMPASRPPPPSPPKVASSAPSPATGKPDATTLLREAESAYAKGNWGAAMRAAQRSQSLRTDGKALRIVAMAACKLQRQDTAQNAFDRLPLGMRKSVRTTCRDAGVKLRL